MIRPRFVPIAVSALGIAGAVVLACSDGVTAVSGVALESSGQQPVIPTLTPQTSGTTSRLQAVSPVTSRVVWASGVNGTFTLTTDGGNTWRAGVVPGAEALQFRDVEAISAKEAYLLSAGEGVNNRIYKTRDGGETWKLQFQAGPDLRNFYDCFDFWSADRGVTFADAVDGRFPVIMTTNGRTWRDIGDRLPPALPGEAGFAASGTCVATQGIERAWITTGAATTARILATTDGGRHWKAYDTPLVAGPSAGGFSVAFRDAVHGIVVGGDLSVAGPQTNNVAVSKDAGKSWTLRRVTPFDGAAFGASYAPGVGLRTVVATGPGGAAWSSDEGGSWVTLPGVTGYWAVAFSDRETGWLVGTEGRILRIDFPRHSRGGNNNDD